jgi:hypothetical protein
LLDLLCAFGLGLELSTEVCLEDLGEESNPWCHLAWLQEVWAHLKLVANEEDLGDEDHHWDVVR